MSTLSRITTRLGWSWKIPISFQLCKYTLDNISTYLQYIQGVQQAPASKIKFADEAHVVPNDLHRTKCISLVNTQVWVPGSSLHQARGTETNSQWSFVDFVISACAHGFLQNGDYFIIDSAPVHCGGQSYDLLDTVLKVSGVKLVFLPAYSPELNPCELVWSKMKTLIRGLEAGKDLPLWSKVTWALSRVTRRDLLGYYLNCIFPRVILPEIQL